MLMMQMWSRRRFIPGLLTTDRAALLHKVHYVDYEPGTILMLTPGDPA
jgi:hypothetical protein